MGPAKVTIGGMAGKSSTVVMLCTMLDGGGLVWEWLWL